MHGRRCCALVTVATRAQATSIYNKPVVMVRMCACYLLAMQRSAWACTAQQPSPALVSMRQLRIALWESGNAGAGALSPHTLFATTFLQQSKIFITDTCSRI
jgi:hypothetical protein